MSDLYIQREKEIPFIELDKKVDTYVKEQIEQMKTVKEVSNDVFHDKTGVIKMVVIESGNDLILIEQLWNKKKKKYHDIQVIPCPGFEELSRQLELIIQKYKDNGENVEILDVDTWFRREEITKLIILDDGGLLVQVEQVWNRIKKKYNQVMIRKYGEDESKFLIRLHRDSNEKNIRHDAI